MKELIIIGLAVLLVYFVYGASQTGKSASNIPPVLFRPENRPVETLEPPPLIRSPAEQYYAVITEEIIEEEVIP